MQCARGSLLDIGRACDVGQKSGMLPHTSFGSAGWITVTHLTISIGVLTLLPLMLLLLLCSVPVRGILLPLH